MENESYAVVQAVSLRSLTVEALVQSQASLDRVFGELSGTETGVTLTTSVFPCQYDLTDAPCSFTYYQPYIIPASDRLIK